MKSTERQAAILLNVSIKFELMFLKWKIYLKITFLPKDLRIKGELLERKITEVEQLKLRIINNTEGNSAFSAAPAGPAAADDEVDQQGYQTFPKQKTPKSSKTPDRVIKQVSTSLKRSSNARHSVQICQVCPGYAACHWSESGPNLCHFFLFLADYVCILNLHFLTQIYSYRIQPIKTCPLAKLMQKDSLKFEFEFSKDFI